MITGTPEVSKKNTQKKTHVWMLRPEFWQKGEKPGFFLQTHDLFEKPRFFRPVTT